MSGAEGPLKIAVAGGSIGGLCAALIRDQQALWKPAIVYSGS
jgi:hypothetical protein